VSLETQITENPPSPEDLAAAAETIRGGGTVVFPTETVYGLGAHAGDDRACRRIFAAKERPADNPLIVHVSQIDAVFRIAAEVPDPAERLFRAFSPGPLSIVLPAGDGVAPAVTAGHDTVAVRIPSHPVAQAFLRACAVPVAAPSANRSGRPSPTTAAMAYRDLAGRVPFILDGGPCIHGVESTVLAVSVSGDRGSHGTSAGAPAARRAAAPHAAPGPVGPGGSIGSGARITIYREGAVTREMIRDVLGPEVELTDPAGHHLEAAPSPGTRHVHYRPSARVVAVEAPEVAAAVAEALRDVGTWAETPRDAGVTAILFSQDPPPPGEVHAVHMPDLASYAQGLYRTLVDADDRGDRIIIAELPPSEGIGRAVRDRLLRAAGR
jgi:L-threonylcarbamoyladenylate synthase